MLSASLLQQFGLAPAASNLEVSGFDAYASLLHWRRSRYFGDVESVTFTLSMEDGERNVELMCLAKFFASIHGDGPRFGTVHFFLNDFHRGINLSLLSDAIRLVHRVGCSDLRILSSYPEERGTSDVEHAVDPDFAHNMERLVIQSPSIFSKALRPWFFRVLEMGSSLTSVDVLCYGLNWELLLRHVFLSNILEIRFVGVDLSNLVGFLTRHPSVKVVRLDGLQYMWTVRADHLALPNLNSIEGDEVQISRFLKFLEPRSRFQPLSIFFRDDCSLDTPSSPFNANACLAALRLLGDFHGKACISLKFNFTSLRHFTSHFFRVDPDSRPEGRLRVEKMEVNFYGFVPVQCAKLLVRRLPICGRDDTDDFEGRMHQLVNTL